MTKPLQIGTEIYDYPLQGDGAGWGEEATDWAEAVTDALETIQGPEDILLSEAILANGGSGNVNGLNFNVGVVKQVFIELVVTRTYSDATPTEREAFLGMGVYNGSTFKISMEASGDDSGVEFDVSNVGQGTYTASSKANTNSLTVKFKAKAIV